MLIRPRTIVAALALLTAPAALAGIIPTEITRLLPAGVVPEDEFAVSLDLDGDLAVVGAPLDDELGEDAGAVYVFRKVGGQWSQSAKLLVSDGAAGDEFGWGIAISGDRIVVIATRAVDPVTNLSGLIYTFSFDGKKWVELDRFRPSEPGNPRTLGTSVALDGDILAVSISVDIAPPAPIVSTAILYHWDGSAWIPEHNVRASRRLSNFRSSGPTIAVEGDVVAIGDYRNSDLGPFLGAVHVLRRDNGVWTEEATLRGNETQPNEQFGWSIDIDDDTIIIGTDEYFPTYYHRTVYVFRSNDAEWFKEAELTAGEEAFVEPNPDDDVFGFEVAISGDIAIVSDRLNIATPGLSTFNGATYIFKRTGATWDRLRSYLIDDGEDFETFGNQIAIDGATALIGNNHWFIGSETTSAAFFINLCGADLNGDGVTDVADLGLLIDDFGAVDGGPADINNDGVTDTADMGILISEFGTPCP